MSIATAASAAVTTTATTSVTATATAAGGDPISGIATTISGIPVDFAMGGLIATILLLSMLVIKELISTRSANRSITEMVRSIGVGIVSLVPLFGIIVSLRFLSTIG
jgi:hypothetical protein